MGCTEGRWDKTEAEVFAEKAIELGVPKEAVLIESNAKNIDGNIELSTEFGGHNLNLIL